MNKLCKECEQRRPERDVYLVERMGGGSYNRAPRWISTLVCAGCILKLAQTPRAYGDNVGALHWSKFQIRRIAATLMTPERR